MRERVNKDYFEWLYDWVCRRRYAKEISYRKLLGYLHTIEFIYTIPKDGNRADDGIRLRYRFAKQYRGIYSADLYLEGPCSVLEMMVALALRGEETIMDDPLLGDRTGQWFWSMITNMGLGSMVDERFDEEIAGEAVYRMMNREYEPNGKGGLFTVDRGLDLREVEIWYQFMWHLDRMI